MCRGGGEGVALAVILGLSAGRAPSKLFLCETPEGVGIRWVAHSTVVAMRCAPKMLLAVVLAAAFSVAVGLICLACARVEVKMQA